MIRRVLSVGVGLVLLTWVLADLNWKKVEELFVSSDIRGVIFAGVCVYLGQVASSIRQWILIKHFGGIKLPFFSFLEIYYRGFFYNQVLPTGLGGDFFKVLKLKNILPLNIAIKTTILDRLWGVVIVGLMSLCFGPFAFLLSNSKSFFDIGFWGALVFLLTIPICVYIRPCIEPICVCLRIPWLAPPLLSMSDFLSSLMKTLTLTVVSTTLLVHVLGVLSFVGLVFAFTGDVKFLELFTFVHYIFLLALLPISFAGWGTRELGAVLVFSYIGIHKAEAVLVSVSFGLVSIAVAVLGIVLFFVSSFIRFR